MVQQRTENINKVFSVNSQRNRSPPINKNSTFYLTRQIFDGIDISMNIDTIMNSDVVMLWSMHHNVRV